MMTRRRMLVVLAHPDDESFPLGGTLAKYAAGGVEITLVCATKGEAGIPGLPQEKVAYLREGELRAAIDILGFSNVRFLGWQDGELAKIDENTVIQQLIAIFREIQPHVIITFGPDGVSGHADHIAIHHWTTAAFDEADLPAKLYYIAPSEATLQGCGVIPTNEIAGGPTVGIDIGNYRIAKVQAAQCHASQNPPFPGDPEQEADQLACHEYFVLARPAVEAIHTDDLFNIRAKEEVNHE